MNKDYVLCDEIDFIRVEFVEDSNQLVLLTDTQQIWLL